MKEELNLHDYLRVIKRRQWSILSIFCLVVASTVFFTLKQVPVYQAKAVILVKNIETPGIKSAGDILGLAKSGGTYSDPVEEAVNMIQSHKVLKRVAERLKKLNKVNIKGSIESFIADIKSAIKVERIEYGNTIKIIARSDNSLEASMIANGVAVEYVDWKFEKDNNYKLEIVESLKNKLKEEEGKLTDVDRKLKNLQLKGFVPGLGANLTNRLMTLEDKLDMLKKKYTAKHPKVLDVSQQIEAIKNKLDEVTKKEIEYEKLKREFSIISSSWHALKVELDKAEASAKHKVESAEIIETSRPPTTPILPNKRLNISLGIILGLLIGGVFAFIREAMDTSIVTVEDVENFLNLPVIGVIPFATTGDEEKQSFMDKVFRKKRKPVSDDIKKLVLYQGTRSHIAEAYRGLRTNLSFTMSETGKKAFVFASSGPKEGKTLTVANFALIAAEAGLKTVLIESDLRRPTLHKMFGLSPKVGLSDIMLRQIEWQKTLKGTTDFLLSQSMVDKVLEMPGIENLKIITAGEYVQNPLEIMGSIEMEKFINELKKEFDLVLFDCPPILMFADGTTLARKVDGLVVVYQIGRTARGALRRTKTQLEQIKINIIGVVINGLRTSEVPYYYKNYYFQKYYREPKKK